MFFRSIHLIEFKFYLPPWNDREIIYWSKCQFEGPFKFDHLIINKDTTYSNSIYHRTFPKLMRRGKSSRHVSSRDMMLNILLVLMLNIWHVDLLLVHWSLLLFLIISIARVLDSVFGMKRLTKTYIKMGITLWIDPISIGLPFWGIFIEDHIL